MCMDCQLFTGKFEKEDRELIRNIFAESSVHLIQQALSPQLSWICVQTVSADVPSINSVVYKDVFKTLNSKSH